MKKILSKSYFRSKIYTKKVLITLDRAFSDHKSMKQIKSMLRATVLGYQDLNTHEQKNLYEAALYVAKCCKAGQPELFLGTKAAFDRILYPARKIEAKVKQREKLQEVRNALNTPDKIFFLCSKHYPVADDHKNYQGKIYIDRFWRRKVSGSLYYAVLSYVRNHQIQTIQEIMGKPVYLGTRPFCKHYFLPINTTTVLGTSVHHLNEIAGIHREKTFDYKTVRHDIYNTLNTVHPCKPYTVL